MRGSVLALSKLTDGQRRRQTRGFRSLRGAVPSRWTPWQAS